MDYDPRNIGLGRIALAYGWLTSEQAKWCLDEATRQGRVFVEVGFQASLLNEQQCRQLMQQLNGSSPINHDGEKTVIPGDLAATIAPAQAAPGSSELRTVLNSPQSAERAPRHISSTAAGSNSRPSVGELFDNYKITRLLGEGGMGAVFAAKQGEVEYALKVITCSDFSAIARFEREATAVAAVDSHPNIVKIHKFSRFNGVPYLVFDMISGKSLDNYIQPGEPYGVSESVAIVETMADVLNFTHEKGILHRDVKPANVLIREDGTPFLTDFGLARSEDSESLTQTSDFLGTPHYMAPEQAASENDKVGPGSDIWALGAILYELVTGFKPFPGETILMIVNSILNRDPIDPRKHNGKLSEDLETIILQCLNKDIDKRYKTAGDLAEDCRCLLAGEPIRGKRLSAYERTLGRLRRRYGRYVVYGLFLIIFGLVCFGVHEINSWLSEKPQLARAQELRDTFSELTSDLPEERAESAVIAAEELLNQFNLIYLTGRTTPRSLNIDSIIQKRDLFRLDSRKFGASYGLRDLPEAVTSDSAISLLYQAEFIEKLARLREKKNITIKDLKSSVRRKCPEVQAERQFLVALSLLKKSSWLEADGAFQKLGRLSSRNLKGQSNNPTQSALFRRFRELANVARVLLLLNGYVEGKKAPGNETIRLLQKLLKGSTQADFMTGVYTYLKLRLAEIETLDVAFKKGQSKLEYSTAAQAKALSLSRVYTDYETRLRELIGEENVREKAAWDSVVSREKKSTYEAFRKTVLSKTLTLSKLGSAEDRKLYYRLLNLFYSTQVDEMKERYVYFDFVDFKLFHTGFKKAYAFYLALKKNPKREHEAYAYWMDSLHYAQKCQSLDKNFKLPEAFSRDGIALVIQQGYQRARQQAAMRKFDLSRKTGIEEMSRSDWALLYQLILAGSRAGVYSHFMGREVIERLNQQGIFRDEIRKAPEDPFCRFWRGMVGPILSNARRKTDDARKMGDTYSRMLSECITDLNWALKDDSLPESFRAVGIAERLDLHLKKFGDKGAQQKLGGMGKIAKEMEWAIERHPTPEVPLYLYVKFRKDWSVAKQLKELDRVEKFIEERWNLSIKSTAGRPMAYWLGKGRPADNPRLPMTTNEHDSLSHRLLRGKVNRLNVQGDHAMALKLINKGLLFRVRADLLCEKVHALLGLGQEESAKTVYAELLKMHGSREPIKQWGEDRLKSLREGMAKLREKTGQ